MKTTYIEIPNSIFDEPWGKNLSTVGLYIFLALISEDGIAATSYGKLVSRTGLTIKKLRGAISNLEASGYIKKRTSSRASKGANKRADQLTEITICHLTDYKSDGTDDGRQKGKQEGMLKESAHLPPNEEKSPAPLKEVIPLLSPKENPSPKRARKTFVKPTVEEVEEYIRQKGYNIDAEYFWNFYETNGWVQGREQKPIKNWKSCVTTWVRKQYNHATTQTNQRPHQNDYPSDNELREQSVRLMQRLAAERHARQAEVRQGTGFPTESQP